MEHGDVLLGGGLAAVVPVAGGEHGHAVAVLAVAAVAVAAADEAVDGRVQLLGAAGGRQPGAAVGADVGARHVELGVVGGGEDAAAQRDAERFGLPVLDVRDALAADGAVGGGGEEVVPPVERAVVGVLLGAGHQQGAVGRAVQRGGGDGQQGLPVALGVLQGEVVAAVLVVAGVGRGHGGEAAGEGQDRVAVRADVPQVEGGGLRVQVVAAVHLGGVGLRGAEVEDGVLVEGDALAVRGQGLHRAGGEVDDPPPLGHRGVLPLDRADGHGPGVAGADGEVPAFRQALQLLVPHLAVLQAQQVQTRFRVLGAGAGDDGVAVGRDVRLALRDRDRDRGSVARPLLERHVRGRGRRVEGDGVGAVAELPGCSAKRRSSTS